MKKALTATVLSLALAGCAEPPKWASDMWGAAVLTTAACLAVASAPC